MTSEYYFDEQAADLAVAFFEEFTKHVKGEWAGMPFQLQDWQRDEIIRPLFGWKRKEDDSRKYRRAYIEIPRKNGKSTLAAGIALLLLFADDEPGAEVYSAAGDKDQAAIIFDIAKKMVEQSPVLAKRCETYRRAIWVGETFSVYRVLSADVPTKHGLNAHGVIFDELHVQPNRGLWDVLNTSTGSRRQPLVVALTTAGYDKESICYEEHEYAQKVIDGIIEDPGYLAVIYAAKEETIKEGGWMEPKSWEEANPNLDVSVKRTYLASEAKRAKASPAYLNTFLRLHLNIWTQQATKWLPMDDWDACAEEVGNLTGLECYGGLDLASTVDIAAFVLAFPTEPVKVMPFFWIPEENMLERARKDRVPYDLWVREGLITATPGNVIDYGYIIREIIELSKIYNIQEIAFDRWGAFQITQQLDDAGLTMVEFGQGYKSMKEPTEKLQQLVLNGDMAHGGHAVLRWMADNVVVTQDPAGNLKPDKKKSREKIDGIVALLMALARMGRHGLINTTSVYEERGIFEI